MATTNYGIDDGDGNQITIGLPEHTARATAQRMANERGETLYLYAVGWRRGDGDDPHARHDGPAEPIEPEAGVDTGSSLTVPQIPDHERDITCTRCGSCPVELVTEDGEPTGLCVACYDEDC